MEIKLRLADRAAHARVAEALRPAFRETHQQENFFFDGVRRELSARRCVMRCRFYNTDKRALLTVKARPSGLRVRGSFESTPRVHCNALQEVSACSMHALVCRASRSIVTVSYRAP